MKIGYARVSTDDQNLGLQIRALEEAGCEAIFQEHITGTLKARPKLDKMNAMLRKGDEVVVWKLDRLGRSTLHLLELVESFKNREIGLISLKENIDISTPTGKLFLQLCAIMAEFEREQTRERTMAGLANARKNGRIGGRPRGLSESSLKKANQVVKLYNSDHIINEIMELTKLSRATVYRYLDYGGIRLKTKSSGNK